MLSVLEVPLDPQVDRFFGTLDDIADWEGQPIAPPPELVGLLTQARDEVEAAGLEADVMWAAGEPGRAIVDAARGPGPTWSSSASTTTGSSRDSSARTSRPRSSASSAPP